MKESIRGYLILTNSKNLKLEFSKDSSMGKYVAIEITEFVKDMDKNYSFMKYFMDKGKKCLGG